MCKISDYKRIFNYFDENGDGKISPVELQRRVSPIKADIPLEDFELVVDSLRSPSGVGTQGSLGFDEFVSLMESSDGCEGERMEEDLRKTFELYEMEGSECITPKSLNRMLSRLGESVSLDECQVMIKLYDLNGDGVLSFDEFKVMML